jgi:polysaccharide biosynthesis protein PslH
MRVLFLTHRLPYAPNRGDRIRAHYLLRTLARHARVDLLSLVHDDDEASHAGDLAPLVDSIHPARVPRVLNLARAAAALAGSTPLTHVLLDSPDVKPALQTIRRTRPPDVVLAYCSGMARYLFEPELRDIPAVVDMVDVDSAKWAMLAQASVPPRSWIFKREARTLAKFEAKAAAHAFATLTVNDRERHALASLAPTANIVVSPNGIDRARFRTDAAPTSEPVVVFCGVMDYAPNVQGARWIAEEVWPRVRAARPDARLTIVGSNPPPAVRRLQARGAGITVTGEVADVRPYLWNAAVAVAPLHLARGLQNKALEALAAGVPCVVTPSVAEGLPKSVRAACPVGAGAAQFAGEVLALLAKKPTQRRAVAEGARLETLDWASQCASVVHLLQQASLKGVNVA